MMNYNLKSKEESFLWEVGLDLRSSSSLWREGFGKLEKRKRGEKQLRVGGNSMEIGEILGVERLRKEEEKAFIKNINKQERGFGEKFMTINAYSSSHITVSPTN